MHKLKALLLGSAAALLALVLLLLLGILYLGRYLDTPAQLAGAPLEFEIRRGQSFSAVSQELAARGIIDHPRLLDLYARWSDQASRLHAGEYLLETGVTPRQLVDQFTSGDVRLYTFTIVEGWNQWELMRAIGRHPTIEVTLDESDWPAYLEQIEALAGYPEGLFLPETYHFPRGTTDRELLRQAHELMQSVLDEEWESRSADAPVRTPYEALILASIIEKETALATERSRIAGVFARRLEKGMRLQTDPTVIYGIGPDFDGNLRRVDLRTDTSYNTYTRGGLPPTPIAMPGRAAIHAALHPAEGDELYFVATGLSDGSHTFSATREEHDAAVAEYLKRLRERQRAEP